MSQEAAPRPWDWVWVGAHTGSGHIYLVDTNGRKIAAIWGKSEEKVATADLIITMVNGYATKKAENTLQAPAPSP